MTNNDPLAFFDNIVASGTPARAVDHVQKVLDGIAEQRKIAEKMIKENKKAFSKFDWATYQFIGAGKEQFRVKIGHYPIKIGKGSFWEVPTVADVIKVYDMAEKVIKDDVGGIQAQITKDAEQRGKKIADARTSGGSKQAPK